MRFTKSHFQQLLSQLPGEYREIFLEQTLGVELRLLNGKIEISHHTSSSGHSLLARDRRGEYFSTRSGLHHIEDHVHHFLTLHSGVGVGDPVVLSWPDELCLSTVSLSDDVLRLGSVLSSLSAFTGDHTSLLLSSDFRILLSHRQFIVANSLGYFARDARYYSTVFASFVWRKDEVTEEVYVKSTGTDLVHTLTSEHLESIFQVWLARLASIVSADPAPSGLMDVIIGSEAGGTIIHEAVWHGLEADLQNSSVYRGKLGQQVAHPSVNIIDDPTRACLRWYYEIDHEGTPATPTYLIKDGILVSYLHNQKSALRFDTTSTGHGRRDDYTSRSIVRMGSTYLDAGTESRDALIARVKDGLYVAQMGGGQVNEATGDFVFRVNYGYRIRDGKITGLVRGANISGNGPEMLLNIGGIADDLSYFDGGTCGKWWQAMPVSDATPTILVRLKVTGIL